jgi:transposase-like protein
VDRYGSRTTLQKEPVVSPRKRRKFTAEQKAEAVRLVKEVGSVHRVARDLDLHETVLGRWVAGCVRRGSTRVRAPKGR